jgi:hypothetical protein
MVSAVLVVGFCLYGPVVLLALLFSYGFVKYWTDSYEESRLLSFVSVLGIALSLSVLMLVPVDVLSSSFRDDSSGARAILLETFYFTLFLSMMILIFIVVPFGEQLFFWASFSLAFSFFFFLFFSFFFVVLLICLSSVFLL